MGAGGEPQYLGILGGHDRRPGHDQDARESPFDASSARSSPATGRSDHAPSWCARHATAVPCVPVQHARLRSASSTRPVARRHLWASDAGEVRRCRGIQQAPRRPRVQVHVRVDQQQGLRSPGTFIGQKMVNAGRPSWSSATRFYSSRAAIRHRAARRSGGIVRPQKPDLELAPIALAPGRRTSRGL